MRSFNFFTALPAGVGYRNPMGQYFGICALVAVAALANAEEPAAPNQAPARSSNSDSMNKNHFGLVIHGGAGTIDRGSLTPEKEKEYRAALQQSLKTGFDILKRGGSSLDAV